MPKGMFSDYEEIARMSRQGYTALQISERLQISPRTVHRARNKMGMSDQKFNTVGRHMSAEDIALAKKMHGNGDSLHSISRTTGFSRKSLRKRIDQ